MLPVVRVARLAVCAGVAAAIAFGASAGAFAQDANGVTATAEGLALWRDDPNGPLFTGSSSGGPTVFTVGPGDFDPDAAAGVRAMLEMPLMTGFSNRLQVGGFYAGNFNGSISAIDPNEDTDTTYSSDLGGIVSPGLSDSDAEEIGAIRMSLETRVGGAEINLAQLPASGTTGFGFFYGGRYMFFGEELNATVFDDFPAGSDNDNQIINIKTRNHLVGAQVGVQGYFPVMPGVMVGGRAAVGLFANFVERRRSLVDQDTPSNRLADTVSDTGFSQAVEVSPSILISLGDGIDLKLGGMLLWINEVSGASPYWTGMLNLGDRQIRGEDDVLFYGATAGLTVKFN